MSKKNFFAAIHIGSEYTVMQILEYTSFDDVKIIEECKTPILLGEETFQTGKLSFEKTSELCELLRGYRRLIADYGVSNYRLLATTAVREAENQKYIIDQIMIKTGFSVEVIDIPQEIFFKQTSLYLTIFQRGLLPLDQATLFVDISSGGLGFILYKNGEILYQQNIPIGILRVKESFEKIQRESRQFFDVLSEFISAALWPVKAEIKPYDVKCLVLSATETKLILAMLGKEASSAISVSADEIKNLYAKLKYMNLPQIAAAFNLSPAKADKALPAFMLCSEALSMTVADKIFFPDDQVIDGLITNQLAKKTKNESRDVIEKQVISLTKAIGQKYRYDFLHAQATEKWALVLFDKLRRVHGLKRRERNLLRAAAMMHDIGKYVCLRDHHVHSYQLILATDIIGFSHKEKEIIANVAYYHSFGIPSDTDANYNSLDLNQKLAVAKLSAILRLANTLDQSGKQKIDSLKVSLRYSENELVIKPQTKQDLSLEEWNFDKNTYLFESVFGIRARLSIQVR